MKDNSIKALAIIMGAITLVAVVATIAWGVERTAARDKEFAIECLEAGGTILYSQCVTGVEPRE